MALADQTWYIESAFGTKRPLATGSPGPSWLPRTLEARRSSFLWPEGRGKAITTSMPLLNTAADTAALPDFTSASQRSKRAERRIMSPLSPLKRDVPASGISGHQTRFRSLLTPNWGL